MNRRVSPLQLRVVIAAMALLVAAVSLVLSTGPPGDGVDASVANPLAGAEASSPGVSAITNPVLLVDVSPVDGIHVLPGTERGAAAKAAASMSDEQPAAEAAPESDDSSSEEPESAPESDRERDRDRDRAPEGPPAVGAIKSKADDKGYDVHGHVEHTSILLGDQVLIPEQAKTGGFVQLPSGDYVAWSPVTAMLPVAIQDNREVLERKPNLEGEKLYRKLAQEYTGSNDYKNLDRAAQRAINILTCTDWRLVDKRVRENTINHLLHSPISYGTIGSVENPISTDVTIDLGYTHTRDKNWTEVEYMDNNVYKITVVSNNNNGSHTGHEMGTAYVEMPAGTSLREAQKIGNRMIPSTNKNNKQLTIDPAARDLFHALPRGASPMILFEHLSEAEQNAFFEGKGIETVGKPDPNCNPLKGGIIERLYGGAEPAPEETPTDTTEAPADEQAPPADEAPADEQAPPADEAPADEQAPPADEAPADEPPAEAPAETPPVDPEETPPDTSTDSG